MFSSGRTSRRRGRSDERPSEASAAAPRIGESANCNENPHVCGKEAACRSLDSETSRCVCPHDLSPPTRDLKCPNRLLAPLTPRPIYNIIVPPNGNGTNTTNATNATNATTTLPDLVEQVAADRTVEGRASKSLTVAISGLALLAFLTLLVYLRRARCTSGGDGGGSGSGKTAESRRSAITSPRSLKTEPPLANGYTPNLHYSNCSPPPEVPLLPRHEVQFLRDIGEGCFGKVFKGEIRGSEPTTKNWVAVKVLKDTASREAEEDFMREVEIMSTFRHENILSLMGVVPRDSEGGPWMIFEYMAYGDLARVLRANGKCDFAPSAPPLSLTKSCLEWTTLQIAAGMDYLSSQRFVHRDLACRNCLVGANLVVKIADFGMSRDVYTCDYYKIGGSRLLPVRWMSPESLVYGRFTLESDVWSFGVVLWEIYSWGKQPYYGRNNEQVVKLIVEGSTLAPPDDCPLFVEKLMHDCWRSEPRERLRFVEILERLELFYRRSEKPPRKSLPRPPQAPVTVRSRDVLDTEGYLLPAPTLPIEYLQTLAD